MLVKKLSNYEHKLLLIGTTGAIALLLGYVIPRIPLIFVVFFFVTVLFILLIIFRIEWGIGLLIASMLFEKAIIPGMTLSLTKMLSLPVLTVSLIKILINRRKIEYQKYTDSIIICLFIWMIFSLVYATNINRVTTSLITFAQLIITYIIIKNIIKNENQLQKLLELVVITGVGIAIFATISILLDPASLLYSEDIVFGERVKGSSYGANHFALGLVFLIPICIYLSITKNKLYIFPVALLSFLILSTFSRGGMVGLSVIIILSIIQLIQYYKRGIIYSIIFLFILVGSFAVFNKGNKVLQRVKSIQTLEGGSIQTRLELMEVALDMGIKNPIWGVGLNNFRENCHLYGKKQIYGYYAHNGFLEIFAMLGLPGFLLFMSLIFSAGLNIWRYQKRAVDNPDSNLRINHFYMAKFIMISFIGYIITAFFLSLMSQKLFWVLIAFSSILYQCGRIEPKEFNNTSKITENEENIIRIRNNH